MGRPMVACKITIGYFFVITAVVLLILVLQHSLVDAKPYDMWSRYESFIPTSETFLDCDKHDEIETLCQRCAKQTKSNVVYPMCCKNSEEAREWCQKYMNFGLQ